jgi:hypothetical protein
LLALVAVVLEDLTTVQQQRTRLVVVAVVSVSRLHLLNRYLEHTQLLLAHREQVVIRLVLVLLLMVKMVELQASPTHRLPQLLLLMVVLVHFAQILLLLERVELVQHQMAQLERQLTTTVLLVDSQHRLLARH